MTRQDTMDLEELIEAAIDRENTLPQTEAPTIQYAATDKIIPCTCDICIMNELIDLEMNYNIEDIGN